MFQKKVNFGNLYQKNLLTQSDKTRRKLLKNYYKNNGYYNVKVFSSFAQLIDSNNFELVFNKSRWKFKFNNITLDIPKGYSKDNFEEISKTMNKLKGKTYSINRIDKILKEIDKIVIQKQFEFKCFIFRNIRS